jgi:XTP/dITP diphosphohydrolase
MTGAWGEARTRGAPLAGEKAKPWGLAFVCPKEAAMPVTVIFATKNKGKLREAREILGEAEDLSLVSMEEAGFDMDLLEDGETFEENALKKATQLAAACGGLVLADDSGIEIDFLGKRPGPLSSRYLGVDTPYGEKNRIILDMMRDVPEDKRTARYVCVMAAAFPDGRTLALKASMEGRIALEARGDGGFGYDPVFFVPELGMTAAELSPEEKNRISHRGKALRMMRDALAREIAP